MTALEPTGDPRLPRSCVCGYLLLDIVGKSRRLGPRGTTAFDASASRPNIVTTEEVLAEFLTYFAGRGPVLRKKAVLMTAAVMADPAVWVLPQTHDSSLAGFRHNAARPDKAYSLADCISMQSMRRESMDTVLTNDHHFRAGRVPPIIPPPDLKQPLPHPQTPPGSSVAACCAPNAPSQTPEIYFSPLQP